jgi:hypothetical protein
MYLLGITVHNGIRVAEVGLALGAIGSALLAMGSAVPFGRRGGGFLGGWLMAIGFVLVIVAVHWGKFGHF